MTIGWLGVGREVVHDELLAKGPTYSESLETKGPEFMPKTEWKWRWDRSGLAIPTYL